MKQSTIVEHVSDWHAHLEIDRENRIVRNVALTGSRSRNGYRYTEQALRDAVALYTQRPVFLDHAANTSRPRERSTRDLVGSIINPRYEADRIRGDIRVLDTDSGRTFLALAESDAPGVGMSHVVLAERSAPAGEVVRIQDVISVDAVVFPATTCTFRESQSDRTVEAPSPVVTPPPRQTEPVVSRCESATVECCPSAAESPHQVRQLLCERDELIAELEQAKAQLADERRHREVMELIEGSGLPDYAITELFRRQLAAMERGQRETLIQDRLELIHAAGRRHPESCERTTVSQTATSDAVFVATLRQRSG